MMTSHSFRARFCHVKNEAPEEEADLGIYLVTRSDKYEGAKPFRHLKVVQRILKVMRCSIGSQCSSCNTGDICSCLGVSATILAAAFWTCWSLSIVCFGSPFYNVIIVITIIIIIIIIIYFFKKVFTIIIFIIMIVIICDYRRRKHKERVKDSLCFIFRRVLNFDCLRRRRSKPSV